MKTPKNDEEAVSPVIGVILMVAIVVILAAIIAAFVFGMVGSTTTSKNVGLTVSPNTTDGIDILWQGGSDINSLKEIDTTVDNGIPVNTNFNPHPFTGNFTVVPTDPNDVGGHRVIIVGTFSDGSTQVIFDKRF